MKMYRVSEEDFLAHEGRSKKDGALIGSGRYPLGSGKNPYQDYRDFRNRVKELRAKGLTEKEIAKYVGVVDANGEGNIRKFREQVTLAKASVDREDYYAAKKMKAKGYSDEAIAEELDRSATGVRTLLKRDATAKSQKINDTADLLRKSLESQDGFIDIGKNSELLVGVPRSTFDAAVKQLQDEGYSVVGMSIKQQFGQGNTPIKVLAKEGTTKKDVWDNLDAIREPIDIKIDSDGVKHSLRPIENVSSKRIQVAYAEDGGIDKDGVIELRRGVKDLDLGKSKYAQVRIGVDGTHYLKGMAVYADDLPDGIDIRFNTNKHQGTPLISKDGGKEVLKPMKDPSNKTNPFGAAIRPGLQRGAINIVNEEGHWDKWAKNLSSQFLSKQSPSLASKQLKLAGDIAKADLDEIKSLTNPTVKRYLLGKFADSCDSDAVHLKAAALPRQASKVILPITSLKDNEVYAPTYKNGEAIALVRHPHGGIFEIPILKVNNRNKQGKDIIGTARDAIGINSKVAGILSGADFDGDTVVAIPLKSAKIKNLSPQEIDNNPRLKKTLGTLRTFDPKEEYPGDHLKPNQLMSDKSKGNHMGRITNLITDMSIKGANADDLTRAVKYSMVVIDAAKHKLDYKKAYKDLKIDDLKARYQPEGGGGGTIVSRAKSQTHPVETKEILSRKQMTPEEQKRYDRGERIYRPTGNTTWSGKPVTVKSNRMRDTNDPYTLTSGGSKQHPGKVIEKYYADYASRMKALANEARKELRSTPRAEWNRSATKTYAPEVESLNAKLEIAKLNAPKERRAQALANSTVRAELASHPEYDKDDEKKVRSRALEYARAVTGAGKEQIKINDKEWQAIQAGAISDSKVEEILKNADIDDLRSRALPRTNVGISTAKAQRAESMLSRGYSWQEVAAQLGVSVSTLQRALD